VRARTNDPRRQRNQLTLARHALSTTRKQEP
jgi:hypothetical protein